jgi:CheY-like chemotaxis protein
MMAILCAVDDSAARDPIAARPPARPRVLLVDDDALIGRAITRVLKECDVEVTSSAEAALARLATQPRPDVVLCDLRLPGMGGAQLHARVALADPALAARFVLITGEMPDVEAGEEAPPVGVPLLRKPPSPDDLRRAIADRMRAT